MAAHSPLFGLEPRDRATFIPLHSMHEDQNPLLAYCAVPIATLSSARRWRDGLIQGECQEKSHPDPEKERHCAGHPILRWVKSSLLKSGSAPQPSYICDES